MKWGVLLNLGALWIGAHWSPCDRRWCINVIPCVTLWIALAGGKEPDRTQKKTGRVAQVR